MILNTSTNGILLDKPPEEAMEILNRLAKNDYQFPTARRGEIRCHATIHELESSDSILSQLPTLTNLVKNMQRPSNTREIKVVGSFCDLCNGNHDSSECPQNPESNFYVGNYNQDNNVMSNTYNTAWKKHSNFSWSNPNNALNQNNQNAPALGFQQNM
ncbi:hypothetical protein HRI_003903000 [Hibiscus trionum]|uniref:Uncharacterized protein n=1 Tax=Hibiscus trionum TaxID=183268 RepID=A0A9W7IWR8_HIBTR|nr:hypothetical protein HRI_003903000 [Hibiscus trionum]